MSRFALPTLSVFAVGVALIVGTAGERAIFAATPPPSMFLSVVDRTGMPVTDVNVSQVTLMLNGMPCKSVNLEAIDWPMKLQVLVDNGAAMGSSMPLLKESLRAFFDGLPEGIESSLVAYSPLPKFVVQPTADPQKFVKALDGLALGTGGAMFIEAASQATTRIVKTKGAFFHTVMVVTTNGPEGTGGNVKVKVSRMLEDLYQRPVTAHVLMFALGEQVDGKVAGAIQAQTGALLARTTQGSYESVSSVARFSAAMMEFSKRIARSNLLQTHQYRVSCSQSPTKSPRMALSYAGAFGTQITVTPDGHIP